MKLNTWALNLIAYYGAFSSSVHACMHKTALKIYGDPVSLVHQEGHSHDATTGTVHFVRVWRESPHQNYIYIYAGFVVKCDN